MEKNERWAELVKVIATENDPEKVRHACEEIDRLATMDSAQTSEKPLPSSSLLSADPATRNG